MDVLWQAADEQIWTNHNTVKCPELMQYHNKLLCDAHQNRYHNTGSNMCSRVLESPRRVMDWLYLGMIEAYSVASILTLVFYNAFLFEWPCAHCVFSGATVQIWDHWGGSHQRFDITNHGGNLYSFRTRASGNRAIDVYDWYVKPCRTAWKYCW